jgi:hypothetical protein
MGKYSSNGPDWIDCEMMMRAMSAVHSGHVELLMQPNGNGLNGGVSITLTMHFDVLPGSSLPAAVVCESKYPCGECGSLMAHIFSGLYALDKKIGELYENSELWKD